MKRIILRSLTIINFRGIKKLEIQFNDGETNIVGRNKSGKSTVMNAFYFLFFGKDSEDRKDYDIKYRDKKGRHIKNQEVEVSAILQVDDELISAGRVYRETWQTIRGKAQERLTGHKHILSWNGVPDISLSEFQDKVRDILHESTFKLLSNPMHFNSLTWKDRRKMLTTLSGEVTDDSIFEKIRTKENSKYIDGILSRTKKGLSHEDIKRVIDKTKSDAEAELEKTGTKQSEVLRGKPEPSDYKAVLENLNAELLVIEKADDDILELSKFFETRDKKNRELREQRNMHWQGLLALKQELKKVIDDEYVKKDQELSLKKRELRDVRDLIAGSTVRVKSLATEQEVTMKSIQALKEEYNAINGKNVNYDELETMCPTCKRDYEAKDILKDKEEFAEAFNLRKKEDLAAISAKGKARKALIDSIAERLEKERVDNACAAEAEVKLQEEIAALELVISTRTHPDILLNEAVSKNQQAQALQADIDEIDAELNKPADEDQEKVEEKALQLKQVKKEAQEKIDLYNKILHEEELIKRADDRILELEQQAKALAQDIADCEATDFVFKQFVKEKMTAVEASVNNMFELVTFQMFEDQINDGEKELCDTMLDGVEWGTLNTAGRVQAGIDIIKTFQKFYGISVPVFIDNRESVTEIPEIDAQIINLVVSPEHNKVTIL